MGKDKKFSAAVSVGMMVSFWQLVGVRNSHESRHGTGSSDVVQERRAGGQNQMIEDTNPERTGFQWFERISNEEYEMLPERESAVFTNFIR